MDVLQAEDTSSFELAGLTSVVAACERFETRWRDGGDPRIDDFVEAVSPPMRERLLRELLVIEIELRAARGEAPAPSDYLGRRPDWAAAIADAFSRDTFQSSPGDHPSHPTAESQRPHDRGRNGGAPGSEMVDTLLNPRDVPPEIATGQALPERFGRYAVLALLRVGGFGRVFHARDEELGRPVAIKILHPGVLRDPGHVESFLAEARLAAGLAHPGIVRVYDVGRYGEGEVFVVFEYVEGRDLSQVLEDERPSTATFAALMARVAEAAHHAHRAGLIHRDLKPANILVDGHGAPHIADFGLAVHEDAQHLLAGQVAGTPAFMAPEQVRGETHRLDARTDVWALGVILYLGLTGRLPFHGKGRERVFRAVVSADPRPPRQLEAAVPRELERICLKCLSKRMSDRYESAADLAEDLKTWLALEGAAATEAGGPPGVGLLAEAAWRTTPTMPSVPIVSRGLRPFDPEDADFFPRLVPGPRDRDGLPESIRTWRRRIEEPDPARSFPVGLIYGPSGSGKSSFVRAGLLPRLARWVRPIYVDAHAEGTEARLLAALAREFPGLPAGCGLVEAAASLREGWSARGGSKVLVVLDQFEQWLHAHPEAVDGELVRALRQCDGAGLQAILLVRDDFWMAITRFLRVLEVRPLEGYNAAAIEPFDARHATRVLAELGCALGRLRDPSAPEEARFLERAVKELAGPDGRIIPVRLTLFAEMLRQRDWTPATLGELGGFEGIGVMFLEETFCAPGAPESHRMHQPAAQAVLKALLPEPSSNLKGPMRPASALREAAGYADRPADFDELMTLLDIELRMVTPVDLSAEVGAGPPPPEPSPTAPPGEPAAPARDSESASAVTSPSSAIASSSAPAREVPAAATAGEAYYQLTHDYLVPPVRHWLARKQAERLRGRAELRLATITSSWRDRPESRRLPAMWEWLMIVGLTRPGGWSGDERKMMRAATHHHMLRAAGVALASAVLICSIFAIRNAERARGLLAGALDADYQHLAHQLPELDAYRDALRPGLLALESNPEARAHRRDVARLLLYRDRPTAGRAASLRERLTSAQAQPEEVQAIRDAMAAHPAEAGADALESILRDDSADPAARLRAACALRALEPGFADDEELKAAAPALAIAILAEHRRAYSRWLELLGPAAEALVTPLGEICGDPGRDASAQMAASEALAELFGRDGQDLLLARIITEATPTADLVLIRESAARGLSGEARDYLRAVLDEVADGPRKGERPEAAAARRDRLAERQAAAAITLAALGDLEPLWPLLRHRPDPRVRSLLIQRLAAGVLPAHVLIERLRRPGFDPIEGQAILLAWAESRRDSIPPASRSEILAVARDVRAVHAHPGVHAAAGLLLHRWRDDDARGPDDARPSPPAVGPDGLGWERGPNGHTFAILPAPLSFRMGSPEDEQGRVIDQTSHYRRIDRSLAVSMTEVTVGQLRDLENDTPRTPAGGEPGLAASEIDWFQAARYCNRLSRAAGIDPAHWCYPEPGASGMIVPADAVEKQGFRLPTEAEWEYICRAGTETARYFGESQSLLSRHAWTWLNSGDRVHPVGELLPNEFGMFDILGNVWEWCHDGPAGGGWPKVPMPAYPHGTRKEPDPDPGRRQAVLFDDGGSETWRILRGGCFNYSPDKARSAHRDWNGSLERFRCIGFRVVRTLRRPPGGRAADPDRRTPDAASSSPAAPGR